MGVGKSSMEQDYSRLYGHRKALLRLARREEVPRVVLTLCDLARRLSLVNDTGLFHGIV